MSVIWKEGISRRDVPKEFLSTTERVLFIMRILLVNPNVRPSFRAFQKMTYVNSIYNCYPLGLVVLATQLKKHGYEVMIFDALAMNASDRSYREALVHYQPDLIGFTAAFYSSIPAVLNAAKISKEIYPHVPILVAGALATFMGHELLSCSANIDYVVRGEGERPFLRLLEMLSNKCEINDIPALTFRRKGQILSGEHDQSSRCGPAFIDSQHIRDLFLFPGRLVFLRSSRARMYIEASRGCNYDCSFCVVAAMSGRCVYRKDPVQVVDEIEGYMISLGANCFSFVDSTFTQDKPYVFSLLQEIEKRIRDRKARWSFAFGTRVDCIDESIVRALKRTRCFSIAFGVETYSSEELSSYNKKVLGDKTVEAFNLCRAHSIKTRALLFLNQFRYHSREMIGLYARNTMRLLEVIAPDFFTVTPLVVYPNSPLYTRYQIGRASCRERV